ncbi:ABC transporter permease [Streptomyces cinnabarinus]|uniref:ABC transporter permease n=1 Tax=Streptomyces cinnabarinus TaxID=67287 RepID=A0ABY7KGT5_9ACTN|nr:ABC transporter permease [Streptomyces cinnabarinus]WAZ22617.1 ABC transporter permease [Streptomyces cinnabarinus]
MTAVTAPATGTAPRPRGPRGLVWVMLRVHRSALLFWLMLVALFAGGLLWAYGPGADAAWSEYLATGCGSGQPSLGCDVSGPAYQRYDYALGLGGAVMGLVPLFAAAWAGSALIGRELENGTARLAWVQSVSPARWLAAKLAVPAALLTAGMVTLTLVHRLVWSSEGELRHTMGWRAWHDDTIFLANGTAATAYALLGLAIGALTGLLLPRALPALAVAAAAELALSNWLGRLRPHLWPPDLATAKDDYPETVGMIVEGGALTREGAHVPIPDCTGEPGCLTDRDITGFYAYYHPTDHFWRLQLVETGIVLAIATLAVLAAFWLLKRRTGAAV